MKYYFVRALGIGGKDFARGVQEVGKDTENHPHFLHHVGLGNIADVDQSVPVPGKSLKDRNKALYERLTGKKFSSEAEKVEEKKEEADFIDEPEEKKSKKKKSKE